MKKTRNPSSIIIKNAQTVIMDNDNNYYCYENKLNQKELKKYIFEIAENDYTIFSDLEIVQSANGFYQYEYIK